MLVKRSAAITAVVAQLLVWAGCRSEAPPAVTAAADTVSLETIDTTALPAPVPVAALPASLTRPIPFSHNPHRDINCRLCHTNIPGHSHHATVDCAQCHVLPGETPGTAVASSECNACHHGTAQTFTCLHCHTGAPAGVKQLDVAVRVSVRTAPTQRQLPFDHARHQALECTQCHADKPNVGSPRPCSSCHARHHQPDAQCATCHPPMPMEWHNAAAHRGCGGSGCHQDEAVNSLSGRQLCLVCHRQQVDHEPGELCSRCHLFKAEPLSSGVP
jgi:Class III cytochrome C family